MTTPTYNELYTSILSDLQNRFSVPSLIGKPVFAAFAAVQAAKLKLIYLQAGFIYKNVFVDTADPESRGGTLERFGFIKLGRKPFEATAGEYVLSVTGEIGATIAANTTFKSLDNSSNPDQLYTIDTPYTFTATTGTISVRSLNIGSIAALQVGDELQVTSPIALVDSFSSVLTVTTNPTDAESYEDYREKTIESYQVEPQGGARTDYRLWAADAAGVRKTYPYAKDGEAGVTQLYIEATVGDSSDGRGTPTSAILTEVEEVVEYDPDTTKPDDDRGRRPIGMTVEFLAVTPRPVDVVINGLSDGSFLPSIESAIESALYDIRPYIGGADNPTKINQGRLYESDIYAIVKEIIGSSAVFSSLEVYVNSERITLYEFILGNIPYLNTLTIS